MEDDLPWARWYDRKCQAVKESNPSGYWGRCELKHRHQGDHALDRGMDIPRWSTNWTWPWYKEERGLLMTDKWQVDPEAMEILRNGNPPVVDWGKYRRAGETLALAMSRDELTEANFDIVTYIRDEIRRKIGDRPYRISATYENLMDFNEDNVIFHIDVLTPIEEE